MGFCMLIWQTSEAGLETKLVTNTIGSLGSWVPYASASYRIRVCLCEHVYESHLCSRYFYIPQIYIETRNKIIILVR